MRGKESRSQPAAFHVRLTALRRFTRETTHNRRRFDCRTSATCGPQSRRRNASVEHAVNIPRQRDGVNIVLGLFFNYFKRWSSSGPMTAPGAARPRNRTKKNELAPLKNTALAALERRDDDGRGRSIGQIEQILWWHPTRLPSNALASRRCRNVCPLPNDLSRFRRYDRRARINLAK